MKPRTLYAALCYGFLMSTEGLLLVHAWLYGDPQMTIASGIGLGALALAASYRFPATPKAPGAAKGPWG